MSDSTAQREQKLKGVRRLARDVLTRLHGGELSPTRLASSVALGLFVGCSPLYGLQSVITGALAFAFRLDVLIAYLASNISLPPVIPVLLFSEVQVGTWILQGRFLPLRISELAPEHALELGAALGVGALVVGAVVAALGGFAAFTFGRYLERRRGLDT